MATERSPSAGAADYTDTTRSTIANVWDNVYLLEFGPDGRCRSFTEFYVERPEHRRAVDRGVDRGVVGS